MEKRVGSLVIVTIILCALFFIQFASAEILISQLKNTYSAGDAIPITITLTPQTDASDFMLVHLVCQQNDLEVYRSTQTLDANTEKQIEISLPLANFLLGNSQGDCLIKTTYNGETATTPIFHITRSIETSLVIQGGKFLPGDTVSLSGTATKNSVNVQNGFAEITVPRANIRTATVVKDGVFNTTIQLPSDIPSGNYNINVRVYEKDKLGALTNQGGASQSMHLEQILKSATIALNTQQFSPDDELVYLISLYDQAHDSATAQVSVDFTNPTDEIVSYRAYSNQSNTFKIPFNATPGNWKISTHTDNNIFATNSFSVISVERASFVVENSTLVITNTGNVPYEKSITIHIGYSQQTLDVKLQVGESKRYRLNAPDGKYSIQVNDGTQKQDLGSTLLTGRAISVEQFGTGSTGALYILFLLIIILIIGIVVVYLFRRFFSERTRRKGYNSITATPFKSMSQSKSESFKPFSSSAFSKPSQQSSFSSKPPSSSLPKFSPSSDSTPQNNSFSAEEFVKPEYSSQTSSKPIAQKMPVQNIRTQKVSQNEIANTANGGVKQESTIVILKIKNQNELQYVPEAMAAIDSALWKSKTEKSKTYTEGDCRVSIFAPVITQDVDNSLRGIRAARIIFKTLDEFNKRFAKKIDFGIGIANGDLIIENHDGKFKFTSIKNNIGATKVIAAAAKNEILCSESVRAKTVGKIKVMKIPAGNYYKIEKVVDRSNHEDFIKRFQSRNKFSN